MADNIVMNPGSGGATVATEDIGAGVQASRVKLMTGALHADGGDVTATNPLPVQPTDGTNAFKSGSAANLAATSAINSQLVTRPGDWGITHSPAANTQATATKAAGASGTRHVCTGISAVITADATAPTAVTVTLNLRDGASGAGTVLQSWTLGVEATAGRSTILAISGLHIVGSDATAMTLEFAAAGGANTLESVNLTGHDAS